MIRGQYDVVVVGGGVGGLVAGGLLAKSGRSVVVLEAEENVGGFARSFTSGGCSFDLADHVIMSCNAEGPFGEGLMHQILSSLGVAGEVSFVALDPFYAIHYGGERFVIPGGREPHVNALSDYFPDSAAGIRDLFALYDQAYRETTEMPIQVRIRDLAALPRRFPLVFRQRRRSLAQLLEEHLADPLLRTVHTALWPYVGLPPSRASALAWAGMMASYAGEGAFYPVGGYQCLADALGQGLRRQGGELFCGERAEAICVDRGAVTGVLTAGGAEISAPTVVVAMDPREALGPMLRGETIPRRYRRRLERGEASMSAYALYLAVDLDLRRDALAHETAVMATDTERAYSRSKAGIVSAVLITTPTLTDPGRSPAGRHTVVVKAMCPEGEARHDAHSIAEAMLDLAQQAIPGLRDKITYVHGRTDEQPWPLRSLGPIYGWSMTPAQMALHRLGHGTPIAGLHLAGHWSQPAAGVWGAAASAVQLVRSLAGRDPHAGLVPIRL
jgi:prolycopene isomerase